MSKGKMEISGKSYNFDAEGTENGDMAAQKNAIESVFRFVYEAGK